MSEYDKASKHIGGLDGWRGIAILLVLVDHATEGVGSGLLHQCLRVGATGVSLFFALSGFLITSRLLEEVQNGGSIDLKTFYIRRAFRLIPASLTYLIVIGLLTITGVLAVTKIQWLSSLLFFRNYIPMDMLGGGWFTSHFWSLTVEEHFYIFWPTLLILSNRRVAVPASIAVAVATWRYIDIHYSVVHAGLWFQGRTDVRLDGLLWGCVLAILVSRPQFKEWLTTFYRWWIGIAFLVVDIVSNLISGRHNYSPYEPALIALILLWPVLNSNSWCATLLEIPAVKWVGHLSYSLYVWQQFWLVFPGVPTPFFRFQHLPLNILCVFACASLSYYAVERPMIRLGHRLTSGKRELKSGYVSLTNIKGCDARPSVAD